jgi:hypothetical protein
LFLRLILPVPLVLSCSVILVMKSVSSPSSFNDVPSTLRDSASAHKFVGPFYTLFCNYTVMGR